MMSATKRRAGEKVGLSAADVVDAAVQIADREGLEAVTMASVAARLGIRSPSLYAHVAGLVELRRLLSLRAASAMAAAMHEAAAASTGTTALTGMAVAYRSFAHDHSGLYDAVQRAVRRGEDDELYDALAEVFAPALRALADAGVRAEERVHLIRAIRSALHGFVTLERHGGFGRPESVDESFGRLVELLVDGVREATLGAEPMEGRNGF